MIQSSSETPQAKLPYVEVISDQMAEIWRKMSDDRRVGQMKAIWRSMREMQYWHVKHDHPDWSEEEIRSEVSRRITRGSN